MLTGYSNWDYLKAMVGTAFRPGMSEYDLWFILAGPPAVSGDSVNRLIAKWAGVLSLPGDSDWTLVRRLAESKGVFQVGDSLNTLLRKLTAFYP